ncbi:FUSC family protein [Dactylosporangium sp. CA-092794]|uniref:FUSC family protein n=1 Tax=Dactylosporangium sp. CA-092794 TaxID=3239929 RepID=UPI003D91C786
MGPIEWLRHRDAGLAVVRRAARTAVVMPVVFGVAEGAVGDPVLATYAAFGSFALLLFADFTGSMADRVRAQLGLGVAGALSIALGTLVSPVTWLATLATAVVAFAVLFAGVVSSVLAGAATALLLPFILSSSLTGPPAAIGVRLAGWGLATAVSVVAIAVLWPAPTPEPLRGRVIEACQALADRLRAEVAATLDLPGGEPAEVAAAAERAGIVVAGLQRDFYGAPYRPTGLGTGARALVRLVDELTFLVSIMDPDSARDRPPDSAGDRQPGSARDGQPGSETAERFGSEAGETLESEKSGAGAPDFSDISRFIAPSWPVEACRVRFAASAVLRRGAELLESHDGDASRLHESLEDLRKAARAVGDGPLADATALDPNFRAQEIGFAVGAIAANIELTAAADRRTLPQRLLGWQPSGIGSPFASARERAAAHLEPHSVWLHNSIRAAAGLAAAVLVARLTGVQHSFWVVLGAFAVLRSNALNTGQTALRALLGTFAGIVVGGVVVSVIGDSRTLSWALLPLAILLAGLAPAVVSFAAGQAAFTIVLFVLFNLLEPTGWRTGIVRFEDVAIGCAVSLAVGLLFWPRGAGRALNIALAEAYAGSAAYLRAAVSYGVIRCAVGAPAGLAPPSAASQRAAAAARRLDDAFRTYLGERGAKPVPLTDVTRLVTGVAGLRLAADAVLDLWSTDAAATADTGDRTAARDRLEAAGAAVADWYTDLAAALTGDGAVPDPLPPVPGTSGLLRDAVERDLTDPSGAPTPTAARMVWTGGHLDAARRLQRALLTPARDLAAA